MQNKEFFEALTDLVREKGISEEAFLETLQNALTSAYKKQYEGGAEVSVELNAELGTMEFRATRYVVEEVTDKDKEISLLIVDSSLTPIQQRNLEKFLQIKVIVMSS